jgi:hypothetical protein
MTFCSIRFRVADQVSLVIGGLIVLGLLIGGSFIIYSEISSSTPCYPLENPVVQNRINHAKEAAIRASRLGPIEECRSYRANLAALDALAKSCVAWPYTDEIAAEKSFFSRVVQGQCH